jgi:Zn-dependent peptidase ImmA (M78 family)
MDGLLELYHEEAVPVDDMAIARINGRMISWARKRAGKSIASLALKGVSPEDIAAWENGDRFPNETQAQNLADRLNIGYPILFNPNVPPEEHIEIPDLRTLNGEHLSDPSLDFLKVIDDAEAKQEWCRGEHIDLEKSPLEFVGLFDIHSSIEAVALDMRTRLSIDEWDRSSRGNYEDFLKFVISSAEKVGVLVMRSAVVGHDPTRKLSVAEFRGFALIDPYAPLIFINDRDAKAAQIFTLAHELVHIWIGQGGVSDRKPNDKSSRNAVEIFCDRVAAQFLAPAMDFTRHWDTRLSLDQNIRMSARRFRVSSLVVLRRAKDLHLIPLPTFYEKIDQQYEAYKKKEKEDLERQKRKQQEKGKKGGGNFWASFDLRNGHSFNSAVVSSVESQRTTYTEASSLFGVGLKATINYLKRVGAKA